MNFNDAWREGSGLDLAMVINPSKMISLMGQLEITNPESITVSTVATIRRYSWLKQHSVIKSGSRFFHLRITRDLDMLLQELDYDPTECAEHECVCTCECTYDDDGDLEEYCVCCNGDCECDFCGQERRCATHHLIHA